MIKKNWILLRKSQGRNKGMIELSVFHPGCLEEQNALQYIQTHHTGLIVSALLSLLFHLAYISLLSLTKKQIIDMVFDLLAGKKI